MGGQILDVSLIVRACSGVELVSMSVKKELLDWFSVWLCFRL